MLAGCGLHCGKTPTPPVHHLLPIKHTSTRPQPSSREPHLHLQPGRVQRPEHHHRMLPSHLAGALPKVHRLEASAPPEAIKLLCQPVGDSQIVQRLRRALCQVDQQRGKPCAWLHLLCEQLRLAGGCCRRALLPAALLLVCCRLLVLVQAAQLALVVALQQLHGPVGERGGGAGECVPGAGHAAGACLLGRPCCSMSRAPTATAGWQAGPDNIETLRACSFIMCSTSASPPRW
jgi:hypothetical protein